MANMRALLTLLPVAFADSAAIGAGGVEKQCARLLGGFAASGHSDTDIAAYCRASYPLGMCKLMRETLGSQPWEPSKIGATCEVLDREVREADAGNPAERGMMDYGDFQNTLEASANQKSTIGYNLPRHRDGTVDLDASVQLKFAETQTIIRAYNQYMNYDDGAADQRVSRQQQKWEKDGHAAGQGVRSWFALAAFAALSLATVGAVGGGVLRRMPRRTVALLPSQEATELPDPARHSAAEEGGDSPGGDAE